MLKKKLLKIQLLTHKSCCLSLSLVSLAQVLALQCHKPVQVLHTSETVVAGLALTPMGNSQLPLKEQEADELLSSVSRFSS